MNELGFCSNRFHFSEGDSTSVVFIKTGSLISLNVKTSLDLSSHRLEKRRERCERRFERIADSEEILDLRAMAMNRQYPISVSSLDFERVGLNSNSAEDFHIMMNLLHNPEMPAELLLQIPIKMIAFPEEGFILVEIEPQVIVDEWRLIAGKVRAWCKEHFPQATLDSEIIMDAKRWSGWVEEYNLKDVWDVVYLYPGELELDRWWLRLPMNISYNYLKSRSRTLSELIERAGKRDATRKGVQSTRFVVDPFGYGLDRVGRKTDQAKVQVYGKDVGDLKNVVVNFLEAFSRHVADNKDYGEMLKEVVGVYESFNQFIESVKHKTISADTLKTLDAQRQIWLEAKGNFDVARSQLHETELTVLANKMSKVEVDEIERVLDAEGSISDVDKIAAAKRYELESKTQMVVDQALYSVGLIYHYSKMTPGPDAGQLCNDIESLVVRILKLGRRSVSSLIAQITELIKGLNLSTRISQIQQRIAIEGNDDLRVFWNELSKKTKTNSAILPRGLESKIKNAKARYRGFDEDSAWNDYFEQNPRTEEASVYDGEPVNDVHEFEFSWLRSVYRDLDGFGF